MTTLIRGGLVHDAVHRDACKADILLADGKIAAIGTDLTAPADAVVFDADGLDVFPGFVDAHTHIGLDGYGIGYEGCDYNEMNDIWTPQLRAIDGINPRDPSLADARKASRYVGALVADFHRTLINGGIYMYPPDANKPNGKLRLMCEANPLAFLAEQAGGKASDGHGRILERVPDKLHARTPLYIGSKLDVEAVEKIYARHAGR